MLLAGYYGGYKPTWNSLIVQFHMPHLQTPINPCENKIKAVIAMGIQEAKVVVVFGQDNSRRKTFTWTLRVYWTSERKKRKYQGQNRNKIWSRKWAWCSGYETLWNTDLVSKRKQQTKERPIPEQRGEKSVFNSSSSWKSLPVSCQMKEMMAFKAYLWHYTEVGEIVDTRKLLLTSLHYIRNTCRMKWMRMAVMEMKYKCRLERISPLPQNNQVFRMI